MEGRLNLQLKAAVELAATAVATIPSTAEGGARWRRKIDAEIKFLGEAVGGAFVAKAEHLAGSNLVHLRAVLETVQAEQTVVDGLDRKFQFAPLPQAPDVNDVLVDVVVSELDQIT